MLGIINSFTVKIDTVKGISHNIRNLYAGDNKVYSLHISLYQDTVPIDLNNITAKIFFNKPDGTQVFSDLNIISAENGKVYLELSSQVYASVGDVKAEIVLYGINNEKRTMPFFTFKILDPVHNEDAVESSNEFSSLTNALSQVQNIDNRFSAIDVQLADIETEFDQVVGNLTVDSEVINARNSGIKGKTFTNLDLRFEDVEKDSYFPMKNEIINGDFSNGATGWLAGGGNGSISTVNGQSEYTVGIVAIATRIETTDKLTTVNGNKYYCCASILPPRTVKAIFSLDGYIASNTVTIGNSLTRISDVLIGTGTTTNPFRVYFDREAFLLVGDKVYIDNIMMLNLTSIFGVGNEPTKAEMDKILSFYPNSWFNGTVNLAENTKIMKFLLNEIRSKASITQEAWITPTLTNGWVVVEGQFVRYMKDSMGFVHIEGRVKNGTIPSVAFVLPTGYRPYQNVYLSGIANNIPNFIYVSSGGSVVIQTGSNVDCSLFSLVFKAV